MTHLETLLGRIAPLIVLKSLARDDRSRPQDAADLRQLMMVAEPCDLETACNAARLIEARGFNRSRNLTEAILTAWQDFRPQ